MENKEYKVQFFKLDNDGDEAIVRFPYTSRQQFDIAKNQHNLKVGNRWTKVPCLRNSDYDPIDLCPICAKNDASSKTTDRFFIKLIKYVQQPDGTFKPQACVWDRPSYVFEELIGSYVDEYKEQMPLTVFKIKRKGAAGDQKTKYDVILPRQDIYPMAAFPADFSAFEDYKLERHSFLPMTAEVMTTVLTTGKLPQKQNVQVAAQYEAPVPAYQTAPANITYPATSEYTAPQVAPITMPHVIPTQPVQDAPWAVSPNTGASIITEEVVSAAGIGTRVMSAPTAYQYQAPNLGVSQYQQYAQPIASDPLPEFQQPVAPRRYEYK